MRRVLPIGLLLLLTALCLSSCQKPEIVSLDKLNTCPPDYNDKAVMVEAYLTVNRDLGVMYCYLQCFLNVSPRQDSDPGRLRAMLERGEGANRLEVSSEFMTDQPVWRPERKPDDEHMRRLYENIQVRTYDNKLVRIKEKVKLTGRLQVHQGQDICLLSVERIEQ